MFANTRFLDMLVIIQTIQHKKMFSEKKSRNLIIAVTHAPFVLISIKTIKY